MTDRISWRVVGGGAVDLRRQPDVAVVEADDPEARPTSRSTNSSGHADRAGRRAPSRAAAGRPSPWTSYSIVMPLMSPQSWPGTLLPASRSTAYADRSDRAHLPEDRGSDTVAAMGLFRRRATIEIERYGPRWRPARGARAARSIDVQVEQLGARLDRPTALDASRHAEPDPASTSWPPSSPRSTTGSPSVSTELANQLTELGHDIDALDARPPATASTTAALDDAPRRPGHAGQRAGPLPDRLPRGPRPPGRSELKRPR